MSRTRQAVRDGSLGPGSRPEIVTGRLSQRARSLQNGGCAFTWRIYPEAGADRPALFGAATDFRRRDQLRRLSVTRMHEEIAQLGWSPSRPAPLQYPTRYKFPARAKDPMKQVMREY